jgi:hypothetical protein
VLGFLVILSAVLLSLTSVSPVAAAPYHQEPSGSQLLLTGCGLPGDMALNDGQVNVADIQAVADHVTVEAGATLTVTAGTVVRFQTDRRLTVNSSPVLPKEASQRLGLAPDAGRLKRYHLQTCEAVVQ